VGQVGLVACQRHESFETAAEGGSQVDRRLAPLEPGGQQPERLEHRVADDLLREVEVPIYDLWV